MCHLRTHLLLEKLVNDTYLHVSQNETRRYQSGAHLTCTLVPLPIVTIVRCHSLLRLVFFLPHSSAHFFRHQISSSLNSKQFLCCMFILVAQLWFCFSVFFSSRACLHIIIINILVCPCCSTAEVLC
jgi:hypothetical protein